MEKAWRKAKFTWAKGRGGGGGWGGGGVRGGGRVDTNKQTTTDEQLRRALHWQRGRGRKRRNDGRERAPQLQKWKVHIWAQYGNMVLISWFNSRSLPFPPSLTTPFPTKLSCFLLQLQFGYKRLLKHRKASKTDKKNSGREVFWSSEAMEQMGTKEKCRRRCGVNHEILLNCWVSLTYEHFWTFVIKTSSASTTPCPALISKLIFSSSLPHPCVACAVRHTSFRVAAKPLVDCLSNAKEPGQLWPLRLRKGSSPASSPMSSPHISLILVALHLNPPPPVSGSGSAPGRN